MTPSRYPSAAALTGILAAAIAPGAGAETVLPFRTFAAHIIAGTGRYAHAHGSLMIAVAVTPTETVVGASKGRQAAWLALAGRQGTISIGGVGPVVGGFEFP